MTRLDRYLLANFLRIFLICMVSLCGMFTVVHLFTNLDELSDLARKEGSMLKVFAAFYGPRTLDFFDRSFGILMLVSGVFTLAMMQRRQEMTAVEAAGIPRLRLMRPIVVAAVGLTALSVLNRELWIPQYRESLVSTAQDWKTAPQERKPDFHKDHVLGLLISVTDVDAEAGIMSAPHIRVPIHVSRRVSRISGQKATWQSARDGRPAGLLLDGVGEPAELMTENDLSVGDRPTVFFPANNPWLRGDQCFVATTLSVQELAFGRLLTEYTSLPEMIESLRRPSQWYSQSNRIAVHSRIVRPILDLSLMWLALPVVLTLTERNLFLAALTCVGITGLFSLTIIACQALGNYSLLRPAALSAWMPVILFLPLSTITSKLLLK